jgi:ADP-ribosylation factor-binding protein GGA
MTENSSAKGPLATATPPPAGTPFAAFAGASSASQSSTPQPNYASAFAPPARNNADPFAGLGTVPAGKPQAAAPAQNDDDEWSFSSALPPEAVPSQKDITVSSSEVKIDLNATRNKLVEAHKNAIRLRFRFSNTTALPISEVHFETAVAKVSPSCLLGRVASLTLEKGYELEMQPQTGRVLQPRQQNTIEQMMLVWHMGNRTQKVSSAKLRWRLTYRVGEEEKKETGAIPEFSIA